MRRSKAWLQLGLALNRKVEGELPPDVREQVIATLAALLLEATREEKEGGGDESEDHS